MPLTPQQKNAIHIDNTPRREDGKRFHKVTGSDLRSLNELAIERLNLDPSRSFDPESRAWELTYQTALEATGYGAIFQQFPGDFREENDAQIAADPNLISMDYLQHRADRETSRRNGQSTEKAYVYKPLDGPPPLTSEEYQKHIEEAEPEYFISPYPQKGEYLIRSNRLEFLHDLFIEKMRLNPGSAFDSKNFCYWIQIRRRDEVVHHAGVLYPMNQFTYARYIEREVAENPDLISKKALVRRAEQRDTQADESKKKSWWSLR